jgi:CMP-N-acetylneuraminic acid synthetase
MIYALQTARGGSKSPKDKNIRPVLGRPLMAYPLLAAKHSKYIKDVYVSTDSDRIAAIGKKYGAKIIKRPKYLAANESLHEDAIVHGYKYMTEKLGLNVGILVVIQGNVGVLEPGIIDRGIEILLKDKKQVIDSCVTVSKYNEYNPARAKRIDENGYLVPFVDINSFRNVTCDRNTLGDTYFCDGGAWICRARCMNLDYGIPPYRWIGRKVVPLIQSYGLDVDDERGLFMTEWWMKRHGFTKKKTPYDKK